MNLNFSGMMDKEIKATILHQFGHALGLGHAIIKPDEWNDFKQHLNAREIKRIIDEYDLHSESDSSTCKESRYDDYSIMKFRYSVIIPICVVYLSYILCLLFHKLMWRK